MARCYNLVFSNVAYAANIFHLLSIMVDARSICIRSHLLGFYDYNKILAYKGTEN